MTLNLSPRTYIVICIGVQLALLGMIIGQVLEVNFPIVRQIVGFVYLSFVPGLLCLKVLTKDKFSFLEEIIYSVGVSLAFVMFSGVIINFIGYYLLKIKPITLISLTLSMLLLTVLMTMFCYYVNKKKGILFNQKKFTLRLHELLMIGLGILIILYAIFAALLAEMTNIFLIFLMILLSVVFIVNALKSNSYHIDAVCVFVVSLALVYYMTVPTDSLPFLNLDNEFWYQSQVLGNGFWDISLEHGVNSVLSIVMLTPIYSIFLDISSIGVWKFVYPIIFALIPVGMYIFYNHSFNKKTASIACMFFIFTFMFFELGATIRRQMIAIFFFSVILMLLTGHRLSQKTQAGLSILFMLSIVVSHYATTYIFIAFLLFSMMISIIVTKINVKTRPFEELKKNIKIKKLYIPSFVVILLLIVSAISWYMYTSTGKQFINLVKVGEQFYESFKNFFEPSSRYGMTGSAVGVGFFQASFWEKVYRIVQYISQLCIVVGVFSIFRKSKYTRNIPQYVIFSLSATFILFLAMLLPFLSNMLHIHRLYFLVLVVLSPCFVIGFTEIIGFMSYNLFSKIKSANNNVKNLTYSMIVAFLIIYFFFHSGFAFAILGLTISQYGTSEVPFSDSLSATAISRYNNIREISAAKFYSKFGVKEIACDYKFGRWFLNSWHDGNTSQLYELENLSDENTFVFLRTWNIEENEIVLREQKFNRWKIVDFEYVDGLPKKMIGMNKIYENDGAKILE